MNSVLNRIIKLAYIKGDKDEDKLTDNIIISTANELEKFFLDYSDESNVIKYFLYDCTANLLEANFAKNLRYFNDNINKQLSTIEDLVDNDIYNFIGKDKQVLSSIIFPAAVYDYTNLSLNDIKRIKYNLDENEFKQFVKNNIIYLNESKIMQYFKSYQSKTIHSVVELSALRSDDKYPVGTTFNLGPKFLSSIHNISIVPFIYVNGNVVIGKDRLADAYGFLQGAREYHIDLGERYLKNMNLHKHDRYRLSEEEWKNTDIDDLFNLVDEGKIMWDRFMIYDDIILGWPTNPVTLAFIKQKFKGYLLFILSDNVRSLTREAKRLISKFKLIKV